MCVPYPRGASPASHWSGVVPVLGAGPVHWQVRGGYEDVRDGENEPGFEWFRRSTDSGDQASSGAGRSIRPGTAVPSKVLVSTMGDGSLLLEGWREGPSAYLSPADALPLRRQLAVAFGSPHRTPSTRQGEAR